VSFDRRSGAVLGATHQLGAGRRAFSLIEVVVVCVILGILAGVAVPRFINMDGRRAEANVREFAELVSSAAARDQLTGQAVALDYDASTRRLRLYVPDTRVDSRGNQVRSGDWIPDPLSRGVELEEATVVSATQDFAELDSVRWRLTFPRGEPRPRLVVILAQDGGDRRWAVVLTPTGTRAQVMDPELATQDQDSVDLDATGKSTSAW
jgi:prepilin-type N-terminal cleavage/methylation domain-containing protein